jgi:hypothetical protein
MKPSKQLQSYVRENGPTKGPKLMQAQKKIANASSRIAKIRKHRSTSLPGRA